MPQNKKRIKLTIILLLTTILISQFFLFSLAKTEVYFSLYDDPEAIIIENISKAGISIDITIYTWNASASTRNDENLLVIDDEEVILSFQRQFENLWENKYSYKRTKELYNKVVQELPYFLTLLLRYYLKK